MKVLWPFKSFAKKESGKNTCASSAKASDQQTVSSKSEASDVGKKARAARGKNAKQSENAAIVENWFHHLNSHDIKAFTALVTPRCSVTFSGNFLTTVEDYGRSCEGLFESMEDFTFRGDPAREVGPGVVVVENAYAMGTHTGKPFGYGPYPPLPATGVHCRNDRETVTFWIKENKIVKIHILAHGDLWGYPGFYHQVKQG